MSYTLHNKVWPEPEFADVYWLAVNGMNNVWRDIPDAIYMATLEGYPTNNINDNSWKGIGSVTRISIIPYGDMTFPATDQIYCLYLNVTGRKRFLKCTVEPVYVERILRIDYPLEFDYLPTAPEYHFKIARGPDDKVAFFNVGKNKWVTTNSVPRLTFGPTSAPTPATPPDSAWFTIKSDRGTGPVMPYHVYPPDPTEITDNWYVLRSPLISQSPLQIGGKYVNLNRDTGKWSMIGDQQVNFVGEGQWVQFVLVEPGIYNIRTKEWAQHGKKYLCIDADTTVQWRDFPGAWERFRIVPNNNDNAEYFGEFKIISVQFNRALAWEPHPTHKIFSTDDIGHQTRNQSFQIIPVGESFGAFYPHPLSQPP